MVLDNFMRECHEFFGVCFRLGQNKLSINKFKQSISCGKKYKSIRSNCRMHQAWHSSS